MVCRGCTNVSPVRMKVPLDVYLNLHIQFQGINIFEAGQRACNGSFDIGSI